MFFPSFPFASELAIVRWRIEVVEAQVGDSVSPVRKRAVRGCIYLVISDFINKNYLFLSNDVYLIEYCIHWNLSNAFTLLIIYARIDLTP